MFCSKASYMGLSKTFYLYNDFLSQQRQRIINISPQALEELAYWIQYAEDCPGISMKLSTNCPFKITHLCYSDASNKGYGVKIKTSNPCKGLTYTKSGEFLPAQKNLCIAQLEAEAFANSVDKFIELTNQYPNWVYI